MAESEDSSGVAVKLGLAVGVAALLLTALTFYNGNARQEGFETKRAACLTDLTEYAQIMLEANSTQGLISPEQSSLVTTRGADTKLTCFESGLVEIQSPYVETWYDNVTAMELMLLGRSQADFDPGPAIEMAFSNGAHTQIEAVNQIIALVKDAPGPGVWPWENPAPLIPTEEFPFGGAQQ